MISEGKRGMRLEFCIFFKDIELANLGFFILF